MSDVKPWTEVNIYDKEQVKRFEQHMVARVLAREVPVIEIILRFRSEAAKDQFLGGLLDGWGENYADIQWDWEHGEHNASKHTVFDAGLLEDIEEDDLD